MPNAVMADSYALSPLQQGMLFHWLLDPRSGTDVEQIVAELNEAIDPRRFEAAWRHAIDSFSTLRTSFTWEGLESPTQQVEPTVDFALKVEDLRSLGAADRERRLDEFLRSDRREGFDLSRAPAMRVTLFQLADAQFRMVWTFHHILIDGRSFETILNHVFGEYAGVAAPVEDRPYREYIEWIARQDPEAARSFWKRELSGFTAPTPLPIGASSPAEGRGFDQREVQLSVKTTESLRRLATREKVTLNTVVMSAWALLLSRHSGETDIVFGATKTTRRGSLPGAESMVGLFLATVPVRFSVDPEARLGDWLREVRERWVAIRGHELLPLVEIRQLSEVGGSSSLFDSLVVFEEYQFGTRLSAQGGPWTNRRFRILEQTGIPLSLLAYGDDGLLLRLEYDVERFPSVVIARLLGHLATILEAWANDASIRVWETPMLTDEERETLLVRWNDTTREYPADETLAALVEAQVERTPDAPAVTHGEATITYHELNARANRLARELRRQGAAPDTLVGLAVERSIDMMVALLAIIKTGAAYVPLDPMFPRDRLAYMVEDSGLRLLVTQASVRESLPPFDGAVVDLDAPTWQSESDANLDVDVDALSLAVVIYTSGSTGRPKGVQVSRGALINLLWSMREWLALDSHDRVLAITTISFDIAGADIWLPWLVGAHTIVASRQAGADGDQLRALIERHDITFMQATPISWRQLLAVGWQGKRDLQAVCTGEAMPPEVAEGLLPRVKTLWNLYGPTETTIWSTGTRVTDTARASVIGRPVANTQCYILDERRQPVPIGAIGELYIAGDGLARGYLNRPDLDAEKFVPDPFSPYAGTRMYRTGDLARHTTTGEIECLGRTDHQVKIRGFRIELGEIEAALREHPDVRQAVVIAREDRPGEKRLVGYVVTTTEALDVSGLRAHLKRSLPEYMVPAAFVRLESFPLTANSKIDRKALPAPDAGSALPTSTRVPPHTHVEKQLSEIWEELFDLPEVGVLDDFFDLGGHSILAVQMVTRIGRTFGKQLPLNALFESPTIEQLARHIGEADRSFGQHSLVTIQATGNRPPIFWIPGGAALGLFRLRHVVRRLGPDQPVYGLGSNPPPTLDQVETVEQRAHNYLELVRRVQPHGPYCFAGFCAGGRVAYEMAQQLAAAGEPVAFVGMINTSFPNYPTGRLNQLLMKLQRLRYQIQAARSNGMSVMRWLRAKLAERRLARAGNQEHAPSAEQAGTSAVDSATIARNEALLNATVEVFERYQPRRYDGALSLFMSNDPAYAGLSRSLDSRYEWIRHSGSSKIRYFPGGHDEVFGSAESGPFADLLKEALDEALAGLGHAVA
ncbi:MAG TPA: amino acid adenylation domain-containing protein [Gemmatimonadaceae bacterium]|nr:amino acid adenylation domain-containing protein [Gemmatimonadaceae bacterium]